MAMRHDAMRGRRPEYRRASGIEATEPASVLQCVFLFSHENMDVALGIVVVALLILGNSRGWGLFYSYTINIIAHAISNCLNILTPASTCD